MAFLVGAAEVYTELCYKTSTQSKICLDHIPLEIFYNFAAFYYQNNLACNVERRVMNLQFAKKTFAVIFSDMTSYIDIC